MEKKIFRLMIAGLMALALIFSGALSVTADEPKYGGTIRLCDLGAGLNAMSFNHLDWNWKHAHDTGLMREQLFAGDLSKGPGGTKEFDLQASAWIPPRVMTGELVKSWEVKKQPPMQIILNLHQGVYWQEVPGVMERRELTAEDVVFSLTELQQARKAIPLYLNWVDKWEAKDRYTVITHLNEWNANWAYHFGWGYYDGIQAPEQAKTENPGDWKNLTGTGPYRLSDYRAGHSYVHKKNPDYWGKVTIKGKEYQLPFADEIIYMLIRDPQTRLTSLRTGRLDLLKMISPEDVPSLKKSNPELQWARYPTLGGYMVSLRMDTKPFDDIRVRRALNIAVNQQEIIDALYGGEGNLVNYPFPYTFPEVYTPLEELPESARELFGYDPEKAKKLLAEAGYPKGFTFKAQVPNTTQIGLDVAEMVVAYLARVGVTLELEPMDYPSYLSMMFRKTHGPGYFFSNDHGNPFATIRKNFVTGQTWNPYMMADKYVDETYEKTVADATLTDEEGFAIMKEVAVYCLDQAPAIWLPGGYSYVAWWPWVKNYHGELRVGAWRPGPIFARMWIDEDLKKKMGY